MQVSCNMCLYIYISVCAHQQMHSWHGRHAPTSASFKWWPPWVSFCASSYKKNITSKQKLHSIKTILETRGPMTVMQDWSWKCCCRYQGLAQMSKQEQSHKSTSMTTASGSLISLLRSYWSVPTSQLISKDTHNSIHVHTCTHTSTHAHTQVHTHTYVSHYAQ